MPRKSFGIKLAKKERFLNLNNKSTLFVVRELQANIDKAEQYIGQLTEYSTGVIQLYHTKRAAKEIVHSKMQIIRTMHHEGVLNEDVG